MGWSFVGYRGGAASKVSGVDFLSVSPTTNLAVGSIVVVRCVSDNMGSLSSANTNEHGLSDTHGHTWTKLREHRFGGGGAGNGVTVSLWATKITTQLGTDDTITLHTSSALAAAKCIAIEVFAVAAGKTFAVAGVSSTHSTTQPSVSVSGLSSAERLWLGHVGAEGPNSDSYTQDPDYSNNTSVGTTGGSDTSNVYSRFGLRIATITGDTFNPTLGTNRDNCALLVVLDEVDDGVAVTPAPAAARAVALIGSVEIGGGGISVNPAFAAARAIAIAPAVQLGSLTLTPDIAAARALVVAPAVQLGSITVTPAVVAARSLAIAPDVQLGSLTLTPPNAAARALAVAPTVQLGSITVTPAVAVARLLAIAPDVQLGSLTLTPAFAASQTAAIAPTVQLGSIAVTPTFAVVRALAVDPVVQLGSLTLTPEPSITRALAVAPDVQISGGLLLTPEPALARALAVAPGLWIRPKEGQLVVTARAQKRTFVAPTTRRSWISSSRDRSWN